MDHRKFLSLKGATALHEGGKHWHNKLRSKQEKQLKEKRNHFKKSGGHKSRLQGVGKNK